jgi:proteasome assembly chaperone (PAC2) family protein
MDLGAKKNETIIPIVGMAGLVPAVARLVNIKGTCLLVETQGQAIDAVGATSLVEMLSKVFKEKIDTQGLIGKAQKTEEVIKKIEEQAVKEGQMGGAMEPQKKESLTYIH